MMIPPSPMIVSAMNAATLSLVSNWIVFSIIFAQCMSQAG